MTEDNSDRFNLSRRKALAGIGGIGIAGVLGGVGTSAMFGDSEGTAATFTAGELDLKIDGKATHHDAYGNQVEPDQQITPQTGYGDSDAAQIGVELGDIKPGDSGCLQVCFEVQDNPAWVWMRGFTESIGENGYTEPEADAEAAAGQKPFGGLTRDNGVDLSAFEEMESGSIQGDYEDLSTRLKVSTFYDAVPTDCRRDNRFFLEDELGVNINERRLRANSGLNGAAAQFGKHGTLLDAIRVEEFDGDVSKSARSPADSNAVSSLDPDLSPGDAYTASSVDAQAGASQVYKDPYNPKASDSFTSQLVTDGYYPAEGDVIGQSNTEYSGFDPSGDCITMRWFLPKDTGNIVQGDAARLNLELYTEQARSNAVPQTPWPNGFST